MKNFLAQFKSWTHAAAIGIAGAVVTYATNPTVHNTVNAVIANNKTLTAIGAGLTAIGLAYANSRSSVPATK